MHLMPQVLSVGVHLFAAWMDGQGVFCQIVHLLQPHLARYCATHPDIDFALLHHKEETLVRRFQALFYAPLYGIHKLTEFDVKEHGMASVLGRSYQSSTLTQFLGQLERLDAGPALLPALVPAETGEVSEVSEVCYVDGHMIAFWSKASMHKGKISMLGRIMAGSQAVITHNQDGHAVFVAYYAPDIRMPRMIVAYCQAVAAATGIEVFVIDREANSVALAREFEHHGLGLLSMLDTNEYDGLTSWETTPIGTCAEGHVVHEGTWKTPRADDPRHFVLVESSDRVLAYWGTARVKAQLAPLQWPVVYRQRTALQEQRFKGMKAHGALDVNDGIKKCIGPDRHQQRAFEQLDAAKDTAHRKVTTKEKLLVRQEAKVAESLDKGHGTRLEQRQRRLGVIREEWQHAKERLKTIQAQIGALGPPQQRADRDFRKQTIMTIRTLLLENSLMAFLASLCTAMGEALSLECLITLLFERSGAYLETPSEVCYWINTAGLSAAYRTKLGTIVEGIGAMNLTCRGKPIRIRLKEAPT
jgi:hypothetical protein